MKKTGYFIITLLPFVIATLIQFIAGLYSSFLYLFMNFFAAFFNSSSNLRNVIKDSSFSTMLMIVYSLISICVFGIWYYKKYEADYLPMRTHPFNRKLPVSLLGIVLLVPGLQFLAAIINISIYFITPQAFDKYEKLIESAGLTDMSIMMFIYSVILAPVCEELIFRGVTFSSAKRIMPFWAANILQAFLFGAFHMNFVQGCYAFVLGLFLGYVCQKGKSIYFSLFLHFLFNLWAAVIAPLISGIKTTVFTIMIILVSLIASLVFGLILFNMGTKKSYNIPSRALQ